MFDIQDGQITCLGKKKLEFKFDKILDAEIGNQQMYAEVAKPNIDAFIEGYNSTIFAYGQTGSGKTYTMLGSELVESQLLQGFKNIDLETRKLCGIIPRAIEDILQAKEEILAKTNRCEVDICASYFEVYNEQLNDLISESSKKGQNLVHSYSSRTGVTVFDHTKRTINCIKDFWKILKDGQSRRKKAAT